MTLVSWLIFRTSSLQHCFYQFKLPPTVGPLSESTRRQSVRFRLGRALMYTGVVQIILRLLYLTYHLKTGDSLAEQRSSNPLMIIGIESFKFVNLTTLLVICPALAFFAIAIDYLIFFRNDHYITKLGNQLMVENGQHLLALNRRQLGELPKLDDWKLFSFFVKCLHLVQSIWNATKMRFKCRQLDEFPNISTRLRARLSVYSTAIELTFMVVYSLFVFFVTIFATSFLIMVYNQLPLGSFLIFTFDVLFICFTGLNVLRVGFTGIHFTLVLSFVSNHHIGELNAQLRQIFGRSRLLLTHYSSYLDYFYHEYTRLKYMAEHTNAQVISPLYAIMFVTIIWLSIVAITNLIYTQLLLSEKTVMALYFVTSLGIPLQGSAALIGWSQSFYSTEPLFFRAQYQLGKGNRAKQAFSLINAKVRLMAFYEIVCTTDKFRFTVGPFGDISKQALYEFCFFYSGMVMFVSDLIRN